MGNRFVRVRFAPIKTLPAAPASPRGSASTTESLARFAHAESQQIASRKHNRSRKGCRDCRQRKVKCDEEFPVCRRCQQRGSLCQSEPPAHGWHLELPWIFAHASSDPSAPISNADSNLLQWWFDNTCHIMVLNPLINPLSYPILEHLAASPALLHTVQSISAAHQKYFDSRVITCFYQRSLALKLIHQELSSKQTPPIVLFLTIFMLGISSSWVDDSFQDFGKEHLLGAHAILDQILSDHENWEDPNVKTITGYYLFWDMAVSLLSESDELPVIDTPEVQGIVDKMENFFHPIGGYSVKIFYMLSILGRYFRTVLDKGQRDLLLELEWEDSLTNWVPRNEDPYLFNLCDAFRRKGLILLNQVKFLSPVPGFDVEEYVTKEIQDHARYAVRELLSVPVTEHCVTIQAIPLTLAASELTAEDANERAETLTRLKAIFSSCRVRTVLYAMSLLEQLWHLHDSGTRITYHELMLRKKWKLSLV
ncbi:hypothetical protein FE257_008268 [Aspergillus nanangensis]|uniref:Zn(2)-C6 fungal-type domain-containing protein n=1 Tax=Aspergillus nanangensis TaxID=2582783 RepID=A0AAD4GUX7_ASPNN|nr:hypothetical protein FE257_008268 [Aspergillus nanangensis]